jgi:PAS domain S-box-containing protein
MIKNMPNVQELKKLLAINDKYINNSPVGQHFLDADLIIVAINDTELNWLGYTREELIGKPYSIIANPQNQKFDLKNSFEAYKKDGSIQSLPVELTRKDGSNMSVLISSGAIYNEDNTFIMTRTVVVDVSEQKRLELELKKANEELYHLNQEKNRFIGVASHDLQNPISAIMMTTELLRKTGGNLTDVQRKLLKNIQNSTERMSSLIKNILNLNRIERGVIQPDFKIMNAKSCVWDVVNRNMIFAERKKIKLSFIVLNEKDLNITTDCNYFSHIIENLISNAIKFTHEGKNVDVILEKKEKTIRVHVKDEGQGIKHNELHLLFNHFGKLSARPTAGEYSTGLGLSIAREYAQILGGSIEVESEWGQGSTFSFVLPTDVNP